MLSNSLKMIKRDQNMS